MKATFVFLRHRLYLSLLVVSSFFATLVSCDKVVTDDVLPSKTQGLQLAGARMESAINQKLSLKDMLGNDVISQNSLVRLGKPAYGFVVMDTATAAYMYVPKANFVGTDSIPYKICQGKDCDSSVVVVVIKDSVDTSCKLQAKPDFITVGQDSITRYPVYINDVACGRFSIRLDSTPYHGTAYVDQQSRVVYTPTPGYSGPDKMPYSICDGTTCSRSWLVISVIAAHPDTATEYCTVQYAKADSVVAPFSQSDSLRKTFSIHVLDNDLICNNYCSDIRITVASPSQGSAVVAADGRTILYTPPTNAASVTTQFDYKVCATCSNQQECLIAPVYIKLY